MHVKLLSNPILGISGTYAAAFEWKLHNRIPELQSQYVQGRSLNGAAAWQGAETNELFSYGPALSTLEFDGSSYPFDVNGKLVLRGSGNGSNAAAYNNSVFRTASGFLQQLNVKGDVWANGNRSWAFGLSLAQSREQTIIRTNNISSTSLGINVQRYLKAFTLSGSYNYANSRRPYSNWNGFLNQTYQQSLLTPVSFSNAQGTQQGAAQRSYSNLANNPEFLLDNNDNGYQWIQQTGGLTGKLNSGNWRIEVTPALLSTRQQDKAGYKPGSAFWPNGMLTDRHANTLVYTQKTYVETPYYFAGYNWRQLIQLQHLYTWERTHIQYMPDNLFFRYTRPANELSFSLVTEYNHSAVKMKLAAGNKSYTSGTVSKSSYWLPSLHYYFSLYSRFPVKINFNTGYTRFNSELPLSRSISGYSLLQYQTQETLTYRQLPEVNSYGNIAPIEHGEWNTVLGLVYSQLSLNASYYIRNTHNDVYPVLSNNEFQLQNIADVRRQGVDISLNYIPRYNKRNRFQGGISFLSYRNNVTRVQQPYNFAPLGGFGNIHTALVQGQPFGAIIGNDYQRDAAGRMVIAGDGFPLVSPSMKVLGNPNPDFIIKSNLVYTRKNLTLSADMEWKRGGDMWNGTQAVLDYYGRSANSAALRNLTGYVFDGVMQNGTKNTIPVSFYDAAQPLEKNRWVRYGHSGVASAYIQAGDYLRINNIKLAFQPVLFKQGSHIRAPFTLSVYVRNILLWSPYKGADPSQTLFEQSTTTGLDFFNIPSYRTYGCNLTIQF